MMVVRDIMSREDREAFYRHAIAPERPLDAGAKSTTARGVYGDPIAELILKRSLRQVQEALGLELDPCYAYFRLYHRGDELRCHTDRAGCEFGVSVTVMMEPDSLRWPLWFEHEGPVVAEPGDGIAYAGAVPHWREVFTGDRCVQLFLHFVRRDGPYASFKYDGRSSLSCDL